jgi:hypothetical protein
MITRTDIAVRPQQDTFPDGYLGIGRDTTRGSDVAAGGKYDAPMFGSYNREASNTHPILNFNRPIRATHIKGRVIIN